MRLIRLSCASLFLLASSIFADESDLLNADLGFNPFGAGVVGNWVALEGRWGKLIEHPDGKLVEKRVTRDGAPDFDVYHIAFGIEGEDPGQAFIQYDEYPFFHQEKDMVLEDRLAAGVPRATSLTVGDFLKPILRNIAGTATPIKSATVTDEILTISGREFPARRIDVVCEGGFQRTPGSDPFSTFQFWVSRDVPPPGVIKVRFEERVTFFTMFPAFIEAELVGYGTAQETIWGRRPESRQ